MYNVNITDGNVSSIIDDLSLVQQAANDNYYDVVRAIFANYGLVIRSENSFGIYDISADSIKVYNIEPIVFPDGYITQSQSGVLSAAIDNGTYDIYIIVEKIDSSGIITDNIQIIAIERDQPPAYTRYVKLYTISNYIIIKDYREENASRLERNPINTKIKPIISSVNTTYNYDEVDDKDFSHVNQRLAFLRIKWLHYGNCFYNVRICPCNENGEEEQYAAETMICAKKQMMIEAIDGKTYSIMVQSKDEEGVSEWSDRYIAIAGSDRKPDSIAIPQISVSKIRDFPTTVAVTVATGVRGYPYYIEVYKNSVLLYTGPECTVTSVLDENELVIYKARVKGPCEMASEFVESGFFQGTFYNPDFGGNPSECIMTIPFNVSETLVTPRTLTYKIPVQRLCIPLSTVKKLAFESKGSYAIAASTPTVGLQLVLTNASVGSKTSLDIRDIFTGTAATFDDHRDYYKFTVAAANPEITVDPDEVWTLYVEASTNTANTSLLVAGTLHIHYSPKADWQS